MDDLSSSRILQKIIVGSMRSLDRWPSTMVGDPHATFMLHLFCVFLPIGDNFQSRTNNRPKPQGLCVYPPLSSSMEKSKFSSKSFLRC